MQFFEIDFFVLFLSPLILLIVILKIFRLNSLLPWIGSAFSIIFLYAFSSISVFIAIISLLLNYFAALKLLKNKSKPILYSTIILNILFLAYFKYSILIDNSIFDGKSSWTWRVALPLGISFYTFQQIAFVVDVYRYKVKTFTFKTYILFKLFFPQFVAGPITHFGRVAASYERWPTFNVRSIKFGLIIFSIGLVKKLIGDYFGNIADIGFSQQGNLNTYQAWTSMLAFTLQIYFDFSGYSDMAVGVARIFGVSLPYNFNSPYKAKNLSDFWRRWHITLSTWLRDYLYIPLGGNRKGATRMALALFLTMAIGGLWHGASWTFLVWGIAHGFALIFVRFIGFRVPITLGRILVFLFIMLTWVVFRSQSFSGAINHYYALINLSNIGLGFELQRVINLIIPSFTIDYKFSNPNQIIESISIFFGCMICFFAPNSRKISISLVAKNVYRFLLTEIPILIALIFILSMSFISVNNDNAFIYFEF